MALNTRGGRNHTRNFFCALVLIDSGRDHANLTPLYYSIAHVSKFIRPGAKRIGMTGHDDSFMATAFKNSDESIAVVVFNLTEHDATYSIKLGEKTIKIEIKGKDQALPTVVIQG